MSNPGGGLGDRMKIYESVPRARLIPKMPVMARMDGKAFHTLTRGMEKPWDPRMVGAMWATAAALCDQVQGCRLAYVQSDEITILLVDYATNETQPWFDYDLMKMTSVAAAVASVAFCNAYAERFDRRCDAVFDARFWNLPATEVVNCFIWRQQDAVRNSILGLGQAHFSHRELHGKKCNEVQEMLFARKGINWNDCETVHKRGACVVRESYRVGEAVRHRWTVDRETPTFTQDRDYVARFLAPEWPMIEVAEPAGECVPAFDPRTTGEPRE